MSRAFVKGDCPNPEEPVKRSASGRPNYVTAAGLAQLRARVAGLSALRAKLLPEMRPDEGRPLPLRQAEADLAYFEDRVKTAKLVDNSGLAAEDVRFGAQVKVRDAAGAERVYAIVGEDEADAAAGRISWSSPLAAALIGKKAGDRVAFGRCGRLELLAVSYPPKG